MVEVAPVAHVLGSTVSVFRELVSEAPAPTALRSRTWTVPLPAMFDASTAIQYVVPAVTEAFGTLATFWVFGTAPVIVPLVSSVPGWPAALLYRPTVTVPAAEAGSRKTRSLVTEPVLAATYFDAVAVPALSACAFASVVAFPTRTTGAGETVPAAQAERLLSAEGAPLAQVAGIAASALLALTSELPFATPPVSRKRSVPPVPRTAIHSVWSAVTFAVGVTRTRLNAPATGEASVPVA